MLSAAATSSMNDSLAKWICGPTGSRRCDVRSGEARSSSGGIDFPGGALVGEVVGFRRHAEAVAGFQIARRASVRPACRTACCRWCRRRRARIPCSGSRRQRRCPRHRSRRAPDGSRPVLSDPSRCPGRACIARAPACRRLWPAPRRPWPHRRRRCGHRSPDPASRSRGHCPPACRGWRRGRRARNAISACRSSR